MAKRKIKKRKAPKEIEMPYRFYVGSALMTKGQSCNHYLRATVEECVEEARKRLAQRNQLNEVYIVEVIKVVRRENPPIRVDDIRR